MAALKFYMQGFALPSIQILRRVNPARSQPPHPPYPKEDLKPLSKPLANLWQEDVIDSGQRPPSIKILVWFAKPVPYGRTILFYIPAVAAPWKGAHIEAEHRQHNPHRAHIEAEKQKDKHAYLQLVCRVVCSIICAVADKKTRRTFDGPSVP